MGDVEHNGTRMGRDPHCSRYPHAIRKPIQGLEGNGRLASDLDSLIKSQLALPANRSTQFGLLNSEG